MPWFESTHDSSSISKTWIISTHDSSCFPGIYSESTHDSNRFPRYCFKLIHDSKCFPIFYSNQLMTQVKSIWFLVNSWFDSESYPCLHTGYKKCGGHATIYKQKEQIEMQEEQYPPSFKHMPGCLMHGANPCIKLLISTYSGHIFWWKTVGGVWDEEAGLSDSSITNHNTLYGLHVEACKRRKKWVVSRIGLAQLTIVTGQRQNIILLSISHYLYRTTMHAVLWPELCYRIKCSGQRCLRQWSSPEVKINPCCRNCHNEIHCIMETSMLWYQLTYL